MHYCNIAWPRATAAPKPVSYIYCETPSGPLQSAGVLGELVLIASLRALGPYRGWGYAKLIQMTIIRELVRLKKTVTGEGAA